MITPHARLWRQRLLPLAAALLVLAGCGSPQPVGPEVVPVRTPEIARPTSSLHYRAYADADALAAAFRWSPEARPMVSAHRGGPTPGYPENAIETFENVLNFVPALIEMDVRQTADGHLVLMHDATVDRTTTGTGRVDEMTFAEIRTLRLLNDAGTITSYRVPTFAETLAWSEGRAVLMLDVKNVPFRTIVEAVRLWRAENRVAVIVYSLEDALEVARLAPEVMISVSTDTPEGAREHLAALDPERLIAFIGVGVPDPETARVFHEAGVMTQAGTFGAPDVAATMPGGWEAYAPFLDAGADVLATDNVPAAAIAIQRGVIR